MKHEKKNKMPVTLYCSSSMQFLFVTCVFYSQIFTCFACDRKHVYVVENQLKREKIKSIIQHLV